MKKYIVRDSLGNYIQSFPTYQAANAFIQPGTGWKIQEIKPFKTYNQYGR